MVSRDNNVSAFAVAPTETPNKMVIMYINEFSKVVANKGTTLLSRIKLPNINIPTNEAADGINKPTKSVTTTGKIIFSFLETGRDWFITVFRSSSVVKALIIGGWIIVTRAI